MAVMDSASRKNLLDVACATRVPTETIFTRSPSPRHASLPCINHNFAPQIDRHRIVRFHPPTNFVLAPMHSLRSFCPQLSATTAISRLAPRYSLTVIISANEVVYSLSTERRSVCPCTGLREKFSSEFHETSKDYGLPLREESVKF